MKYYALFLIDDLFFLKQAYPRKKQVVAFREK